MASKTDNARMRVINEQFMETWAELARDRELAEIYHRALSGEDLDEIDAVRYVAFANIYLAWLEVLYTQARVNLGFTDLEGPDRLMDIAAPYYAKILGNSAGRSWWLGDARHNFSPTFYTDVSKRIDLAVTMT